MIKSSQLGLVRANGQYTMRNHTEGSTTTYRGGTPNLIFHTAISSIFSRFSTSDLGLSTEDWGRYFGPNDSGYEDGHTMLAFWQRFELLMQAGTGSRRTVTLAQFLASMKLLEEMMDVASSLLALRSVTMIHWEAAFGESTPRELTELRNALKLGGEFESYWGNTFNDLAVVKAPAPIVNFIYMKNTPYSKPGANSVMIPTAIADLVLTESDPAAAIRDLLNGYLYDVRSTDYMSDFQLVLHNFVPSASCVANVAYVPMSAIHINGLINANKSNTDVVMGSRYAPTDYVGRNSSVYYLASGAFAGFTPTATSNGESLDTRNTFFDKDDLNKPLYMWTVDESNNFEDYVLCPFAEAVSDPTPGYTTSTMCYFHGLVKYGDFWTVDQHSRWMSLPNLRWYAIDSATDLAVEGYDFVDHITDLPNIDLFHPVASFYPKVQNISEGIETLKVHRDTIQGLPFAYIISSVAEAFGLERLITLTEMSGVQVSRQGVKR